MQEEVVEGPEEPEVWPIANIEGWFSWLNLLSSRLYPAKFQTPKNQILRSQWWVCSSIAMSTELITRCMKRTAQPLRQNSGLLRKFKSDQNWNRSEDAPMDMLGTELTEAGNAAVEATPWRMINWHNKRRKNEWIPTHSITSVNSSALQHGAMNIWFGKFKVLSSFSQENISEFRYIRTIDQALDIRSVAK